MDYYLFLVGLFTGSFFNVLIDRLPKGQNVLWGRSHCDYCKKNLRWYELIPVVSYILQIGACRRCHKRLSIQYPLIELLTATSYFFLSHLFAGNVAQLIWVIVIFSSFIVMTVADIKFQIIPDSMIILAGIGTVSLLYTTVQSSQWLTHGVSALCAFCFFYALWYGTKGRGMGFGDVKLALILGLMLGFPLTVVALYIAFLTGAFVGVILIIAGNKTLKSKISFGPFLIIGALISYLFQSNILSLWSIYF